MTYRRFPHTTRRTMPWLSFAVTTWVGLAVVLLVAVFR